MSYLAFVSAVMALLLAPGPTNTLMAVAGARGGVGRVARLLPVELAGYLCTILPLTVVGDQLLAQWPVAATALKAIAAVWVMVLAVRLWGLRDVAATARDVTGRDIYVTTLLNPKALIFGLVLLPAPADPQFLQKLGLFCLMVVAAALTWGGAGALTQAGTGGARRLQVLQRVASVWLGLVSLTLIAGVLRA